MTSDKTNHERLREAARAFLESGYMYHLERELREAIDLPPDPPRRDGWEALREQRDEDAAKLAAAPKEPEPAESPAEPEPDKRGLFNKFTVTRNDGTDKPGGKHDGCDYFVLDLMHDMHAKAAILAYADACERDLPQLAKDLRDRMGWAQPPAEPAQDDEAAIEAWRKGCMPPEIGALLWAEKLMRMFAREKQDALRAKLAAAEETIRCGREIVNEAREILGFPNSVLLSSAVKDVKDRLAAAEARIAESDGLWGWIAENIGDVDFHVLVPAGIFSSQPWVATGSTLRRALEKARRELGAAMGGT